ncbi:MAG: hypothetical protein KGJ02_00315 [Verrucomicrobiota bacterium]|nr:hypothetical protein [Verrucomicrobiota bacterium]
MPVPSLEQVYQQVIDEDRQSIAAYPETSSLHQKKVADAILKGAEGLRGRVIILSIFDRNLPLAKLAEQFDEVVFVNPCPPKMDLSLIDKIYLKGDDFTGILGPLIEKVKRLSENKLYQQFPRLLSQLRPSPWTEFLRLCHRKTNLGVYDYVISVEVSSAFLKLLQKVFSSFPYRDQDRALREFCAEIQTSYVEKLKDLVAPKGRLFFCEREKTQDILENRQTICTYAFSNRMTEMFQSTFFEAPGTLERWKWERALSTTSVKEVLVTRRVTDIMYSCLFVPLNGKKRTTKPDFFIDPPPLIQWQFEKEDPPPPQPSRCASLKALILWPFRYFSHSKQQ